MGNSLILAAIGITFAAMHIWRALRDDQRERNWEWWAGLILLALFLAVSYWSR